MSFEDMKAEQSQREPSTLEKIVQEIYSYILPDMSKFDLPRPGGAGDNPVGHGSGTGNPNLDCMVNPAPAKSDHPVNPAPGTTGDPVNRDSLPSKIDNPTPTGDPSNPPPKRTEINHAPVSTDNPAIHTQRTDNLVNPTPRELVNPRQGAPIEPVKPISDELRKLLNNPISKPVSDLPDLRILDCAPERSSPQ